MKVAQLVQNRSEFVSQLKKRYEKTGVESNFRRTTSDGSFFMRIGSSITLDKIVRNEVTASIDLRESDAVITLMDDGWEVV